MALNFGLLGQGPQFENVLAAFQQGREQRKETDVRNALAGYDRDPEGSISALTRVDPALGMKMRDRYTAQQADAQRKAVFQEADPEKRQGLATETGDPEIINAVGKLDDRAKAELAEKNETVARAYFRLSQTPPDQRAATYQEIQPALAALGVPDFDPMNDAVINAKLGQALTIDQALALKKADEAAAPDPRDPLKDELTRAQIDATRALVPQREASAERARRPAASSGGAAKPNKSAPPPGFTERVR